MINTIKELEKSTAIAVVITKELGKQLLEATNNNELKELMDKPFILLSSDLNKILMEQIKRPIIKRASGAGRPRIPEPNNPETLVGSALLKWKNRIWKRSSRERLAKEVSNV
jgi:hypothetical protein